MPYKRRYKKKTRRPYKKRRYNRNKMSISYAPSNTGIQDTSFVKLVYNQDLILNLAASEQTVFTLNGIFAPWVSGSGHQPLGFDEYSNFYESNQCYASKIHVKFINTNALSGQTPNTVQCMVFPSNLNQPIQAINNTLEQPYVKWKSLSHVSSRGYTDIISYMTVKKMEARNVLDKDFQSTFASLPKEQKFWIIRCYNDRTSTNLEVRMLVRIEYYVKFFDRVLLAQS